MRIQHGEDSDADADAVQGADQDQGAGSDAVRGADSDADSDAVQGADSDSDADSDADERAGDQGAGDQGADQGADCFVPLLQRLALDGDTIVMLVSAGVTDMDSVASMGMPGLLAAGICPADASTIVRAVTGNVVPTAAAAEPETPTNPETSTEAKRKDTAPILHQRINATGKSSTQLPPFTNKEHLTADQLACCINTRRMFEQQNQRRQANVDPKPSEPGSTCSMCKTATKAELVRCAMTLEGKRCPNVVHTTCNLVKLLAEKARREETVVCGIGCQYLKRESGRAARLALRAGQLGLHGRVDDRGKVDQDARDRKKRNARLDRFKKRPSDKQVKTNPICPPAPLHTHTHTHPLPEEYVCVYMLGVIYGVLLCADMNAATPLCVCVCVGGGCRWRSTTRMSTTEPTDRTRHTRKTAPSRHHAA